MISVNLEAIWGMSDELTSYSGSWFGLLRTEKGSRGLHLSGKKIFCIGFNKTGTHSLHNFFKTCGLISLHDPRWPNYSKIGGGKYFFYLYQCYSDGEQCDFVRLQHWFPSSVFILNNRDEKEWLRSRIKHVLRFNEELGLEIISSEKYGDMAKQFVYGESNAICKWVLERRIYIDQARKYFEDKGNFIEIDITTHPDWLAEISRFLKKNEIKTNMNLKNSAKIHEYIRQVADISDEYLLKKYYKIVDDVLEILAP